MKDIINKLDNILNEGHLGQMADRVELDHEVQMARADLYKLAKYSIKLHDMLKNVSELNGIDGWQASKITKAADYIGSVYHSMDAETTDAEQEMDALADVIMPTEHDNRVCMDCADTIHHPTDTGCPYDGHDENGENWMDPMGMSEEVSELTRLSGISEIKLQGPKNGKGAPKSQGGNNIAPQERDAMVDQGLERDTTTGNPADGIGAKAAAANAKAMKDAGDLARQGKKNESKFSDWGKK